MANLVKLAPVMYEEMALWTDGKMDNSILFLRKARELKYLFKKILPQDAENST